ncbi:MAG: hypothetical protein V5A62_00245 [Haloarculaceae archaeon]
MGKRKIAYTLLLVGVTFVALLHTALALAFDTGLEAIGVLVAGLGVFGILFVNVGIPDPPEESDPDPEPEDAGTGSD